MKLVDIITDKLNNGLIMIFHVFQNIDGSIYYRYLDNGVLVELEVPTKQVILDGKIDYTVF